MINEPSGVDFRQSRSERHSRWCIFTSAGDNNAIDLWVDKAEARRWDLVVAYYGDDDAEFERLARLSALAFRVKGSKFQNLKKLVEKMPRFFEQYTHVCVCDDDIHMSAAQIDEFFSIAQMFEFWIAQPAFSPGGKWSHEITIYAGHGVDYRIVNFVEVTIPIFRRDKLLEFLEVYDGSLVGFGIDFWYMNLFKANEYGRFAIIDKVQVINPTDYEKGGREIDTLQSLDKRLASWAEASKRNGILGFPPKVFAYCRIASPSDGGKRSVLQITLGKLRKAQALLFIAIKQHRSELKRSGQRAKRLDD